jgi:hypothetical protein
MLQFVPGDFELSFRALVLKAIQPHVFHKNVEAVNKSASGRIPVFSLSCSGGGNTWLLKLLHKVNAQGKRMHVTEVIAFKWDGRTPGQFRQKGLNFRVASSAPEIEDMAENRENNH